jgi:DNA mismatch endonuclease, patch repair protein
MERISKAGRSKIMKSVRSKNTKPELKVRKILFGNGVRYRLHVKDLPGSPDIAIRKYKIAIEVRGCFWHHHDCKKGKFPRTNKKYWIPKIERTVQRDIENGNRLTNMGYALFVLWECEVDNEEIFGRVMRQITNCYFERRHNLAA